MTKTIYNFVPPSSGRCGSWLISAAITADSVACCSLWQCVSYFTVATAAGATFFYGAPRHPPRSASKLRRTSNPHRLTPSRVRPRSCRSTISFQLVRRWSVRAWTRGLSPIRISCPNLQQTVTTRNPLIPPGLQSVAKLTLCKTRGLAAAVSRRPFISLEASSSHIIKQSATFAH